MNQASQNRLKKVHPDLAKRVTELIEALATQGHTIEVVQALRTFAEQDELYKQGRTNPCYSNDGTPTNPSKFDRKENAWLNVKHSP